VIPPGRKLQAAAQIRVRSLAALIERKRRTMFLGLALVLLLLWLGGFFVFHVTAFFIHILLILAVVSIVFHFMRGTASAL
jgi:uncharacterized protein DUF5670